MQSRKKHIVFSTLKELLSAGQTVEIPVYGLSMFPTYLPGDVVRAKRVDVDQLKLGDIVFFQRNNQVVFHRLVKLDIRANFLLTKGDGLVHFDKPFGKDDLLGVAKSHYRNDRKVTVVHSLLFKRIIVFLSPLIGYFNFFIARLWIKLRKN